MLKKAFKAIVLIVLIPVIYIGGILAWSTAFDFQPESKIGLISKIEKSNKTVDKDTLSFFSWNIGYGGLGAQSNFFYDNNAQFLPGGKMVRSPRNLVEKYQSGIKEKIGSTDVDFHLIQEVDVDSKRSYYTNEYDLIGSELYGYNSVFAKNYNVSWVPVPYLVPWNTIGTVNSGVATFSKYDPTESYREVLPGEYEWPVKVFHLDRCIISQRYSTHKGKDLVVINAHFSAYDKGGFIKKQQVEFLTKMVEKEYAKGNYIVVGGDWNQTPQKLDIDSKLPGWKLAYDAGTTTARSNKNLYKKGSTREVLIDYFLVSPNIEILECKTDKMDFAFSDHEPVRLGVVLR